MQANHHKPPQTTANHHQNTRKKESNYPFFWLNLAKARRHVHFHSCTIFIFMQAAFFVHRKALARGQLLRLCMCVAPPIEYTWCQFKMTSLKCPYLSKPQVIILTVSPWNIAHHTKQARHPIHRHMNRPYTSSQILHIYGISVVICGGLSTRQAASNHHKPPLKHRKYAGFGMIGIRKSIVLHQHGLATLNEP